MSGSGKKEAVDQLLIRAQNHQYVKHEAKEPSNPVLQKQRISCHSEMELNYDTKNTTK